MHRFKGGIPAPWLKISDFPKIDNVFAGTYYLNMTVDGINYDVAFDGTDLYLTLDGNIVDLPNHQILDSFINGILEYLKSLI